MWPNLILWGKQEKYVGWHCYKNMIIKTLSENLSKIINSYYNWIDSDLLTKRQQNLSFLYSKGNSFENSKLTTDNAFNRPITQISSDTITSPSRFSQLQNYELSKSKGNNNEILPLNATHQTKDLQ